MDIEKPISIHFLYTEEDLFTGQKPRSSCYFNPLPLYRGRLTTDNGSGSSDSFQSTSSIQRKTKQSILEYIRSIISIHFLYTEEDQLWTSAVHRHRYFNPLPLYRGRQVLFTRQQ